MVMKKTILPSLRNQAGRRVKVENDKNKRIINTYHNELHHGIKRTNLFRGEISLWKKGVSLKNINRNALPGWEIRLENW